LGNKDDSFLPKVLCNAINKEDDNATQISTTTYTTTYGIGFSSDLLLNQGFYIKPYWDTLNIQHQSNLTTLSFED